MYFLFKLLVITFLFPFYATSGEFHGELVLYPKGCETQNSKICKLGALLTYKSSRGEKLVWQTDVWEDDEQESGTTDGASIPKWAQNIIGKPFDESYVKAAIVHDHYCYKENHVRTWKQTHLMFYDALIDLNVSKVKAKTMYFAVYLGGPRWEELVPGENCGIDCIKYNPNEMGGLGLDGDINKRLDAYRSPLVHNEIAKIQSILKNNPNTSLEELEAIANKIRPVEVITKIKASK
jgi:uncharacterized protein DUF1353